MKLVYLICVLSFLTDQSFAQADSIKNKYWISGGMWMDDEFNGSININYCFSYENYFFKTGYIVNGASSTISGNIILNKEGYIFRNISFSIGNRLKEEYYQSNIFIGPSISFGKQRTLNRDKYFTALGVLTEAQLFYLLADEVGFGVTLYGDINYIKSFNGITFSLLIGNGL